MYGIPGVPEKKKKKDNNTNGKFEISLLVVNGLLDFKETKLP